MAQKILRANKGHKVRPPIIGASSEVFAVGSPVTINADGNLAVASSSGEKIYGFCTESVTLLSTNANGTSPQTSNSAAIGYAPQVIHYDGVEFRCLADTTFKQTDIGTYLDIASETDGVVILNQSGTTSGQFFIVGLGSDVDPAAATNDIIVTVAEPQDSAAAQA